MATVVSERPDADPHPVHPAAGRPGLVDRLPMAGRKGGFRVGVEEGEGIPPVLQARHLLPHQAGERLPVEEDARRAASLDRIQEHEETRPVVTRPGQVAPLPGSCPTRLRPRGRSAA